MYNWRLEINIVEERPGWLLGSVRRFCNDDVKRENDARYKWGET